MAREYRRPYTNEEQLEFNEVCAQRINEYWAEYGLEANAHVERKHVFVENIGKNGRKMWSEEIVSSVSQFPGIKKQYLGLI